MATREFVDSSGVRWRVWNTIGSHLLNGEYATGWLTFQSDAALRRLAPIPVGWESATDAQLERLLGKATVPRRTSGPHERPSA